MLHEDPLRHDLIGIQRAGLDQMLDLRDRDASRGGHDGIEVARRAPIDQVAEPIALPRTHEREVGGQRLFEDKRTSVDYAGLLALGDERAVAGWREESADA